MTAVQVDVSETDVFTVLRAFLLDILPAATDVIRAQVNRVPAPTVPNYVVMNSAVRSRVHTNIESWDMAQVSPTQWSILVPALVTIQCDVHGPLGADNAWRIEALLRGNYGVSFFAGVNPKIIPLFAEQPRQIPFINTGTQQYEDRWCVTPVVQANVTVTIPQDFANALVVGLIDADAGAPGILDFSDSWSSQLLPTI